MDQPLARREALRIFRLLLIVQLVFVGVGIMGQVRYGSGAEWGFGVRILPTLLLAVLFLPPWLEDVFGRFYLALGLGLLVLFSSLDTAYLFPEWMVSRLASAGIPADLIQQLILAPPIEPFFFLLIPLVLLAWGYGRTGALLGSTLAAALHLGVVLGLAWVSGPAPLLWAQLVARIVLIFFVPLIVSVLAERERQQHGQLETAYNRLRRHTAAMEQLAVSRERNRLARDLHDTLAHSLSALTVQLEALRALLAHDPEQAQAAVDEITDLARGGLEESRQAIQALRSGRVETLGLTGAVRDMVQVVQMRNGVQAELIVAGDEPDLTREEAQALFRIAEESLTNIDRHAAATQVMVRLAYGADRIDLVIKDDGRGFDPEAVGPEHFGLTGMAERAEMAGASLKVRSRPQGGTEVWCTLER